MTPEELMDHDRTALIELLLIQQERIKVLRETIESLKGNTRSLELIVNIQRKTMISAGLKVGPEIRSIDSP